MDRPGARRSPLSPQRPADDVVTLRRAQGFVSSLVQGPWPRRPGSRELCAALVVADVDLDTGTVTELPMITEPEAPPEGVHAVVWLHGHPIGQVTVAGDPATVAPRLADVARSELQERALQHLLRDALATGTAPGTSPESLCGVHHPVDPRLDGSAITVAVCTRDRPDDLRRCLDSIASLRTSVAEVLVIDNASADDRTRRVASASPGVRYVREPRQGLDWARNRALLEARTPVVAFTDDDVLVHPGWVAGLVHAFAEEPDAVAVTGLVVPAELSTRSQVLFESQGGFGRGFDRNWFSVAVEEGDVAGARWGRLGAIGTGANMALRREPALALGGFDPALDVGTPSGGGGDLEMFFRLVSAGHLVVYEPSAVVRHRHRTTMAALARQRRGDGTGSYSFFVGAGARYGRAQRRAFLRFAVGPAVLRQAVWFTASALRPRMRPWLLARSLSRGGVDAVLRRYYRQGVRQAGREAARHPDEPTAPPLSHPAARDREPTPQAVVTVDLDVDAIVGVGTHPAGRRPGRRLDVVVRGRGRPDTTVSVRADGARVSTARLRWELVAALGPAVVASAATDATS